MAGDLDTLAAPYIDLCNRGLLLCSEPDPGAMPDERQLQTFWQEQACRLEGLALPDGTPVEILDPGRWNHSLGPDFRDALVSVGGLLRRGDVELHLCPADWDRHRHAGDPEYAGLILHATWEASPPAKTLPPGVPALALRPFAEKAVPPNAATVRPDNGASSPRPCARRLAAEPGALDQLLVAAGHFRLLAKSKALSAAIAADEPFQVFYRELLGAMGYGRNSAPFRRLAGEVPFARLAPFPALTRFAVLAATAGLLKEDRRALWDLWWQTGLPPPATPYAWDFRAMRPANHPFRRLAGAVGVLHAAERLWECPLDKLPDAISEASTLLCEPLGLSGRPIGLSRANAIVANLVVPYRLATGTQSLPELKTLPGEDVSMPMREVWHRLTGEVAHLPKDGLRQQGLLQLYTDFCTNPHLTCATCPVAAP